MLVLSKSGKDEMSDGELVVLVPPKSGKGKIVGKVKVPVGTVSVLSVAGFGSPVLYLPPTTRFSVPLSFVRTSPVKTLRNTPLPS